MGWGSARAASGAGAGRAAASVAAAAVTAGMFMRMIVLLSNRFSPTQAGIPYERGSTRLRDNERRGEGVKQCLSQPYEVISLARLSAGVICNEVSQAASQRQRTVNKLKLGWSHNDISATSVHLGASGLV